MTEKQLAMDAFKDIKVAQTEEDAVAVVIEYIIKVKSNSSLNEALFRSELNSLILKKEEGVGNEQILKNIKVVEFLLGNEEKIANDLYKEIKSAANENDAVINYLKAINNIQDKDTINSILKQYFEIPLTSWRDFQASSNIQKVEEILNGVS